MQSKAETVDAYLAGLPAQRREALARVREVINGNLPEGYVEGMAYGMIGWCVPHSIYPAGYHCNPEMGLPFASLASQKNHMSLGLMFVYGSTEQRARFLEAWKKSGRKLDMGAACVRFQRLDDLPLDVIGRAIARVSVAAFVRHYEEALLHWLWFGRTDENQRASVLTWLDELGKWSMLDVYMVAVLIVAVKLGPLAQVTVEPDLYVFGGAVLLSMLVGARIAKLARKANG